VVTPAGRDRSEGEKPPTDPPGKRIPLAVLGILAALVALAAAFAMPGCHT
jgi:hypothetical protein